jgi:protoporphyrinogen oxidase
MSDEVILVVGSGAAGLAAGAALLGLGLSHRIVMAEPSSEIGGLLRSFRYPEGYTFDVGMHNLLETGDPEVDALVLGALPDVEWEILSGARRDLAGLMVDGLLHTASPYLDIRSGPQFRRNAYSYKDGGADEVQVDHTVSAADVLRERFGTNAISDRYIQALELRYGCSAEELDASATCLTPMDRVVLADEETTSLLYKLPGVRDFVAWPEQRSLPRELQSGRSSYYPRRFGMFRYAQGAIARLETSGARVLTRTSVVGLHGDKGRITAVTLRDVQREWLQPVSAMIWTGSPVGLSALLKQSGLLGSEEAVRPSVSQAQETWVVNLIASEYPSQMGDLYYFFSYDSSLPFFRLTSYSAYCADAEGSAGFPLSVEIIRRPNGNPTSQTQSELEASVPGMLEAAGLLERSSIGFCRAELLPSGFPLPSIAGVKFLRHVRDEIRGAGFRNVHVFGIQPDRGIFFQRDVTLDVFDSIRSAQWL